MAFWTIFWSTVLIGVLILFMFALWLGMFLTTRKMAIPQGRKIAFNTVTAIIGVGWFVLIYQLGKDKFFVPAPDSLPLAYMIAFVAPLLLIFLAYCFIPTFRQVILTVPLTWMFIVQSERIVAVNLLYFWHIGELPGIYAIPTTIGDVISGVVAIPVTYFFAKHKLWARKLAIGWTIFGLLDLLDATVLGILAGPGPFRVIHSSVSTAALSYLPLIMLSVLVPLLYLLHIFSLIRLVRLR